MPAPRRSPSSPYILEEAKPGEPQKVCATCGRSIGTKAGFSMNRSRRSKGMYKEGLLPDCKDCEYIQRDASKSPGFDPAVKLKKGETLVIGPPLKQAYYVEKVINGTRMMVREVR
jgi:hypothetical protein